MSNIDDKDCKLENSYKRKYQNLKRIVKEQVYLNAAKHDEIYDMERHFQKLKNENKMLLRKLFEHLPMSEAQCLQSTKALESFERNNPGKVPRSILSPVAGKKKGHLSLVTNNLKGGDSEEHGRKRPLQSDDEESRQREEKPKRKKPGTARKKVQPLHLNEAGVPRFPITMGTLTVHDLGEISWKEGFHSERYIWPVGYFSTRLYPSMKAPEERVRYFCYIKDGGTDPLFEIVPEDEPDKPISAGTATAAHCAVLKRLNAARGKVTTNTGSGPEFFGFSHPTVQYLMEGMRGAEGCTKYQPQVFELPSKTGAGNVIAGNVIRENNLPKMKLYDRTVLKRPSIP